MEVHKAYHGHPTVSAYLHAGTGSWQVDATRPDAEQGGLCSGTGKTLPEALRGVAEVLERPDNPCYPCGLDRGEVDGKCPGCGSNGSGIGQWVDGKVEGDRHILVDLSSLPVGAPFERPEADGALFVVVDNDSMPPLMGVTHTYVLNLAQGGVELWKRDRKVHHLSTAFLIARLSKWVQKGKP